MDERIDDGVGRKVKLSRTVSCDVVSQISMRAVDMGIDVSKASETDHRCPAWIRIVGVEELFQQDDVAFVVTCFVLLIDS